MNSATILIVDDDQRNIFALAAVLRSRDYKIITAMGMKEALTLLDEEKADIILLDMMMPGMDGYEGITFLKQNKHSAAIPVIAVTAQAMSGDREKVLSAGADDYLTKPVDVDLLLKKINHHLKK